MVTAISDMYPLFFQNGHRRKILLLLICIVSFLVGLMMVTEVRTQMKIYFSFSIWIDDLSDENRFFLFIILNMWCECSVNACITFCLFSLSHSVYLLSLLKGRTVCLLVIWLLCLQWNDFAGLCHSSVHLCWMGLW